MVHGPLVCIVTDAFCSRRLVLQTGNLDKSLKCMGI